MDACWSSGSAWTSEPGYRYSGRTFELTVENAGTYLGRRCGAVALGGGVSNTVVMVEAAGERFVLKQSLGKLRVAADWHSDRARVFRESAALRHLAAVLGAGAVPEVLFEDRSNFLFAMTAAPRDAVTWKELLLRGEASEDVAEQVGGMLGTMIASTWRDRACEAEFGDQTVFKELRVDPYYRTAAQRNPDLAGHFDDLIAASAERRVCLVHGDWSPKNFLVADRGVMAIDFEAIHYGDPSFDAAFLLTHLILKSLFRVEWQPRYRVAALRFWNALRRRVPEEATWFDAATIRHLGALLLARVDGKSPAEYIRGGDLKLRVRRVARDLISDAPPGVERIWERLLD